MELDVERKLQDIALRRNEGLPGFREMLRIVQRMEDSVGDALSTLGQRLDRPAPIPTPKPKAAEKKAEPKSPKPTEVLVNAKEWDRVTEHMKNSWMETLVSGKILYVNCFDEKRNTWEKPKGFIQTLPAKEVKTRVVYEEIPRPSTRVYGEVPTPVRESRRREPSRVRRSPEDDAWARPGGW